MNPVQKKRTTDVPQGELNFTKEAEVYRYACGAGIPQECAGQDEELDHIRRPKRGYIKVDDIPSTHMPHDKRFARLEAAADAFLRRHEHTVVSTDEKPKLRFTPNAHRAPRKKLSAYNFA